MTTYNIIQHEALKLSQDNNIPWHKLSRKTVLLSGATGLIGQTLALTMLNYSCAADNSLRIIILVRNCEKARLMFSDWIERNANLSIMYWDTSSVPTIDEPVDYIIHCASQTSSKGFVEQPVETISTAYSGTNNLLQLAKTKNVSGFVFLSTMEVYGAPQTDIKIDETFVGSIDPSNIRNCYPESKRLCENLCMCYASEYNVPVFIARLTQTFGPGVQKDDSRIFAEFARCVIENRDILLHTAGNTKRNYVYTFDAAQAILMILLCGSSSNIYNIANECTYCSIYDMAKMVANDIAHGKINVKRNLTGDISKMGYAPTLCMNLDTAKLRSLGWEPRVDLHEMYEKMIMGFTE